jgi:hypothetical protein
MYSISPVLNCRCSTCEGPHLLRYPSSPALARPRVVEGRGDERDGADAGVDRYTAGVAAAEADPDAAEAAGVDGRMRGENAGRAAQVLQLAGRVFVLTRFAAASAEATVVEHERGQPAIGQPARIVRDDLLFHTGERAGQHDPGHAGGARCAARACCPRGRPAARCPEDGRDALSPHGKLQRHRVMAGRGRAHSAESGSLLSRMRGEA